MIRWLPLILGVASIAAGCAPGSTGTQTTSSTAPRRAERIIALAGTVGAMALLAPDAAGRLTPEGGGLPPTAAWLSGNGSALLATTLEGRALIGSGGSPSTWQPAPGDLSAAEPLRAFGSLGPDGQVAFVEGDPGAGTPGRLVVESLGGGVLLVVPLPSTAESPAAWLPDGRIAVVIRDANDEPETLLVDPDGRTHRLDGPPLRSIAIGGGLVAVIDETSTLRVGSIDAWLAGSALQQVSAADPGETAIQAQPSPSGAELAVVLANAEGDADSIRVLAAADDWHEIARFGLPDGANRAVVSWLAVTGPPRIRL